MARPMSETVPWISWLPTCDPDPTHLPPTSYARPSGARSVAAHRASDLARRPVASDAERGLRRGAADRAPGRHDHLDRHRTGRRPPAARRGRHGRASAHRRRPGDPGRLPSAARTGRRRSPGAASETRCGRWPVCWLSACSCTGGITPRPPASRSTFPTRWRTTCWTWPKSSSPRSVVPTGVRRACRAAGQGQRLRPVGRVHRPRSGPQGLDALQVEVEVAAYPVGRRSRPCRS